MRSKLSQRWLDRLKAVESPDTTFVNETMPIVMKNGRGMFITDVDGRRYTDFNACFGVLAFGHRSTVTLNTIRKQSRHMIHGMGDVHPTEAKIQFLELLAKMSPYQSPKVHLSSSGADAVESALKTSILYTGRHSFISFKGSYHGLHMGALSIAGMNYFKRGFEPFLTDRNVLLDFPTSETEVHILTELEEHLKTRLFAGVVVEVMQARGGERLFSKSFLKSVRELTKKYQTCLIFDEVYTGFYRTGKRFALEHVDVLPDLLCVGKALGGGLPLSACVGEILDCWGNTNGEARHTSTFLGHPLACAVGYATLKEFFKKEESLLKNASRADASVHTFAKHYHTLPIAKELPFAVYGSGFMHGLSFYKSKPGFAAVLMERLLLEGFIVLPSGEDARTLSLSPPLIAESKNYHQLFQALIKVLPQLLEDSK